MKIRVGTRGSHLALTQTNMVIDALKAKSPDLEFEVVIIKTKGDKILNVSLDKIGDKGLFVKEIEEQLMDKRIDMAIHSLKDMPGEDTSGLMLLPVLKREDPRDVLVTTHFVQNKNELPDKMAVATGSKRRFSQLKMMWPSSNIEPIRGNVETRIKKMLERDLDGTVLAYAGINRIGLKDTEDYKILPFEVHEMIPAPAQGVLGLQLRKNDTRILSLAQMIIDKRTALETQVERAFLKALNGSCHLPMGAYLDLDNMKFYGIYGDEACDRVVKKVIDITEENALEKAIHLAEELVKAVRI